MSPMDPLDARINLQVKAVLVSRYVDTSKVDFYTMKGVVYLRGPLLQIKGGRAVLTTEVDSILDNVCRISGVKDVVNDLNIIEKKAEKHGGGEEAEQEK